jgi:hypothetical protein
MSPAEIRRHALDLRRDELLTVQEFAYVAKQTPAAVYKRIARGLQPGVCRIGGEIRIDLALACQPFAMPIEPTAPTEPLHLPLSKVS